MSLYTLSSVTVYSLCFSLSWKSAVIFLMTANAFHGKILAEISNRNLRLHCFEVKKRVAGYWPNLTILDIVLEVDSLMSVSILVNFNLSNDGIQ